MRRRKFNWTLEDRVTRLINAWGTEQKDIEIVCAPTIFRKLVWFWKGHDFSDQVETMPSWARQETLSVSRSYEYELNTKINFTIIPSNSKGQLAPMNDYAARQLRRSDLDPLLRLLQETPDADDVRHIFQNVIPERIALIALGDAAVNVWGRVAANASDEELLQMFPTLPKLTGVTPKRQRQMSDQRKRQILQELDTFEKSVTPPLLIPADPIDIAPLVHVLTIMSFADLC